MPVALRAALVLSAILGFWLLTDAHRGAYDFQAFYCAGASLREGADPYRAQPLGACEHRQTDGTYAALPANVVLPAPQPPYDLALFALFSLLPFLSAKAAWGAMLGVASAIAVAALAKAARLSALAVFMAFAASLLLPSFAFGQIFALYAAACACALLFAARGQWTLAGIAGVCTLVEPHLGLPVCVALAVWNPRARGVVCAGAAALALLSIAAAGWRESLEYAVTVLPMHALAEIDSDAQLSLTAVLHALGASEGLSLQLGAISYGAAAAAGVWLGGVAGRRLHDDRFLVAVPAACAVAGGTFIHATEMIAAIPLALLLLRVPKAREFALPALVLLSVPWFAVLDGGTPLAFATIGGAVVFYEVRYCGGLPLRNALAIGLCAGVFLVLAPSLDVRGPGLHARGAAATLDPAFPQASWRALTDSARSGGAAITWMLRGASWAGLLLLGWACSPAILPERLVLAHPADARSTPFER